MAGDAPRRSLRLDHQPTLCCGSVLSRRGCLSTPAALTGRLSADVKAAGFARMQASRQGQAPVLQSPGDP